MINSFPNSFANKALMSYIVSLLLVTLVFFKYAMAFQFVLFGLLGVIGFFYGSSNLTRSWMSRTDSSFEESLFVQALIIRIIWVLFSYFYYIQQIGQPFEWGAADAMGYHEEAKWLSSVSWDTGFKYWFSEGKSIADSGYPIYLTALYSVFGPNIIVARLFKALYSSITCVLIFRLASRNFGQGVGRMSGIFCMLMPNLIIYCGLHLKETEMLFLTVALVERADLLLRSGRYSFASLFVIGLLAASLFFFRTVLGAIAVLSFFLSIVLAPGKAINATRKLSLFAVGILFILVIGGSSISAEVSEIWESRTVNQELKRSEQVSRGNSWAKYATGTVMTPMSFVLPFSTMVHADGQEGQLLLHSGNFVKNCLGIFVLLAVFSLIFIDKTWREHVFMEAFTVGYLIVVSSSSFANAERFHIPTLPLLLVFAAYGVSKVSMKNLKLVNFWFYVVILMELAWAYFKIGSRGLL